MYIDSVSSTLYKSSIRGYISPEEFALCRSIKCHIISIIVANGSMKCMTKTLIIVGSPGISPESTHITILGPYTGTALIIRKITTIAQ